MNASKARAYAFGNVSCQYGAPMGRHDEGQHPEGKLYAFAARCVDGGYDEGGAYWGTGGRGWVHAVTDGHQFVRYVRASNRGHALALVFDELADIAGVEWQGARLPAPCYRVNSVRIEGPGILDHPEPATHCALYFWDELVCTTSHRDDAKAKREAHLAAFAHLIDPDR